jgi:uncharacterized membrane protein
MRGEAQLATGAFLLFFTNFISIQVAASVVLWLHGYNKITNLDQGFKKLICKDSGLRLWNQRRHEKVTRMGR